MSDIQRLKLCLGLILAFCCMAAAFTMFEVYRYVVQSRTIVEMRYDSRTYQAEEEIEMARTLLQRGIVPATVVTEPRDASKILLCFNGLPSRADVERLVKVLQKHHAQAVFFVEGQNAANDEESIQAIRKGGYSIQNYTFVGMPHGESQPEERMIQELCRTQEVIKTLTGTTPTYFQVPFSTYTPELLQIGHASGLDYALQPTVLLIPKDVGNADSIRALAAALSPGAIVAIETGKPAALLTMKEKAPVEPEAARDRKPTVKDREFKARTDTLRLSDFVDTFLTALEEKGLTTTSL